MSSNRENGPFSTLKGQSNLQRRVKVMSQLISPRQGGIAKCRVRKGLSSFHASTFCGLGTNPRIVRQPRYRGAKNLGPQCRENEAGGRRLLFIVLLSVSQVHPVDSQPSS